MDSLMRAWAAFMDGDPERAICETQFGSGDHRRLCALVTTLVAHHGEQLENWKDTPQTFFGGRTPREALRFDNPDMWARLSHALDREVRRGRRWRLADMTHAPNAPAPFCEGKATAPGVAPEECGTIGWDEAEEMGAGRRMFLRVVERWSLSDPQIAAMLGFDRLEDLALFREDAMPVTIDLLLRIGCVMCIYQTLSDLHADPEAADAWIWTPLSAPKFAGVAPVKMLSSGRLSDLRLVRQYVEAQL